MYIAFVNKLRLSKKENVTTCGDGYYFYPRVAGLAHLLVNMVNFWLCFILKADQIKELSKKKVSQVGRKLPKYLFNAFNLLRTLIINLIK